MEVTRTSTELRAALKRAESGSLALVPTMGAFHEGHLSLMRAARRHHDAVAVSVFVNPLQFGAGEDLAIYPRDLDRDVSLARREGVDVMFVPDVEEMFPPGHQTRVSAGHLAGILEGAARPGHFDGVCTVVALLLNLVSADVAYFGQKDAQQVAVIKRMVTDLSFSVRVEVCATVREHDGLALSSRNAYLSDAERKRAVALYEALGKGRAALEQEGDPRAAEEVMVSTVGAVGEMTLDYARAVDPTDFSAARPRRPTLLLIAARVGRTRLIDNVLWNP